MLSKENKQKLTCLAGLCDHEPGDSSCLFLKYVDKGPEAFLNVFEKIIEDEIKRRGLKDSEQKKTKRKTTNVKKKKSVRK